MSIPDMPSVYVTKREGGGVRAYMCDGKGNPTHPLTRLFGSVEELVNAMPLLVHKPMRFRDWAKSRLQPAEAEYDEEV